MAGCTGSDAGGWLEVVGPEEVLLFSNRSKVIRRGGGRRFWEVR